MTIKGCDPARNFGQDSMDCVLDSVAALLRSWQTLAGEAAGFSRKSFEEGAAYAGKAAWLQVE